jgi:hypothetical protein
LELSVPVTSFWFHEPGFSKVKTTIFTQTSKIQSFLYISNFLGIHIKSLALFGRPVCSENKGGCQKIVPLEFDSGSSKEEWEGSI